MHSSRTETPPLPDRDPLDRTPSPMDRDPLDRDPPGQSPLDREPLEETWDQRQRPPGRNMGPGSQTGSDIIQRPHVNRMTHVSKKITLPQTSFSEGINKGLIQFRSLAKSSNLKYCCGHKNLCAHQPMIASSFINLVLQAIKYLLFLLLP